MDWPGAEEISTRLAAMLPPQLQGKDMQNFPPEARAMLMSGEDGPDIGVAWPVLAAILLCAVVAGAGGLVPQWFVDPALKAAESITIPLSR